MPEGDTVYVLAGRLHEALAGSVITKSDFRVPRFATADLRGQTVDEVVARGKHLLLRTDDGVSLHTHLEMDGEWHIYTLGQRWRRPAHAARVVLETRDRQAVGFRLPVVELIQTARESDVLGHLGPDLLGPDWDAEEALRRITSRAERALGDALLDQRVMAGLGNIYKSEVCFLLGVHPATPVSRLRDPVAVVSLCKRVIEANRSGGNQVTTGDPRPGRRHWVYGRSGRPCRRCGTAIKSDHGGEPARVTFWCPSCQPGT